MKGQQEYGSTSVNEPYGIPPPSYSISGQETFHQQSAGSKGNMASAPHQPELYPDPYFQQQPSAPPAQTVVYTNTVSQASFGPFPIRYTCPKCHQNVLTTTYSTVGNLTYLASGALCFLAGCLCCCLIPCCFKRCKDVEHRCPECQHKLGLFKRI